MRKFKYLFLLLLIFLITCPSVSPQGKNVPFNLSLIYPISINRSIKDNVTFNLGIIGSKFNNLNGVGINGGFSCLENNMTGLQINGVYSEIRNRLFGLQITGGVNNIHKGGTGVAIGGLANMIFDDFKGVQSAIFTNLCFEKTDGVQVAGFYNFSGGEVSILQLCAGGNITGQTLKGVQLSFLFNFASFQNNGLQISALNITKNQRGVQIGLFNLSTNNSGLQLGILNTVTEVQSGTTLGLFYVYKNTKIDFLLSAGNLSYATLGVRFKRNNIYTMADFGGPVVHSNTTKSILLTYRVGYSFNLDYLNINTDIGLTHFANESNQVSTKLSKNQFGIGLRVGVEKYFLKRFGLFINTGYYALADSYKKPKFSGKFLIEGGFILL